MSAGQIAGRGCSTGRFLACVLLCACAQWIQFASAGRALADQSEICEPCFAPESAPLAVSVTSGNLMLEEEGVDPVAPMCELPPETGMCRAFFQRWYFDPASRSCSMFVYGGCGGNENNFRTQAECDVTCGADPRKTDSQADP
mmetsp:Transcript_1152/g.3394  ORF Transcript_1152/g.3394 Transcript_1152/m.3394 type:complete len:143 (-) Transcript_1152:239-667(-)|eukprot:CAMPEP_0117656086 /NCGR_PEP_ID=MMETSP0804-20121206/4620_1 /TAXON_ID=1074897 /ORGANISM="Tetraselmis astigmatica, Strain CCMP880" /LENGTH=142 /DNA_ID=CAMNT_0005462471 /DNA_START=258 /DNA_END=686 /DNA_ORIENTATION=+